MSESLYRANILDHYEHPRNYGDIAGATHRAEGANLSCGDELVITAKIKDGQIESIGFTARACAVCTASTSMLLEDLAGKPVSAIKEITKETVTDNLGIPLSPVRLKCALLPAETLKNLH